jgi:hypothetical protein
MGFGIALASGFIKEANAIGREKAKAKSDLAQLAQENAVFEQQEMFKARIQSGVARKKRGQEIEDAKRLSVSTALQKGLEEGTLTPQGIQAIGQGLTSMNPEWFDLSKTQSALDAVNSNITVLGSTGKYTFRGVGEMEYGTGASPYKRSQVFWDSWQNELATEDGYDKALQFFQNDEVARQNLQDMVRKNEFALRVGNIKNQKVGSEGEAISLQYIDLTEQYGAAARLFDDLGFKNVEEPSLKEIAGQTLDIAEDEEAILFPTQDTSEGGIKGGIFIPLKKTQVQTLSSMATRIGYNSPQELVSAFNFKAGERQDGMSDAEFATKQNSVLFKAIELERQGFGNMLANPALMNEADATRLYKSLKDKFGNDKQAMAQAVSLLVETPPDVFTKTRKYRYSGNINQKTQASIKGQQFVETITNLKPDDFNEGLKAQTEAVDYIDRLMKLEAEIGEKVGTGWVKDTAQLFGSFGIQISQVPQAIGALFGANGDFAATDANTNQADLQAVVRKVLPDLQLDKITEAEAIRLTLAAKMARAVDPAGRLSNQDFEIQLRRLGDKKFTTPQQIRASLELIKKEFEADLEYKNMLKRVMDDQTKLTPQVARTVQAHIKIKEIENGMFGTTGRESLVTADEEAPVAVTTVQSSKTLNGQPVYIIRSGPNEGLFSLDPEGTQVVPDDQVGNLK